MPSACRLASTATIIPEVIVPMPDRPVAGNWVLPFVVKVAEGNPIMEPMANVEPETLETLPTWCCMPPCQGFAEVPDTVAIAAVIAGLKVTFPDPSMPTEEAMFMSKFSAAGAFPTVMDGLKGTVAVKGPARVFCV